MLTLRRPNHEKHAGAETCLDAAEKIPVCLQASFKTGQPAKLSVSCGDILAGAEEGCVQAAQNQPVSREMIAGQLSKTGNTPFVIESMDITMDENIFLQKKAVNELRRKALDELNARLLSRYRRKVLTETVSMEAENLTGSSSSVRESKELCFTAVIEEPQQLSAVL